MVPGWSHGQYDASQATLGDGVIDESIAQQIIKLPRWN